MGRNKNDMISLSIGNTESTSVQCEDSNIQYLRSADEILDMDGVDPNILLPVWKLRSKLHDAAAGIGTFVDRVKAESLHFQQEIFDYRVRLLLSNLSKAESGEQLEYLYTLDEDYRTYSNQTYRKVHADLQSVMKQFKRLMGGVEHKYNQIVNDCLKAGIPTETDSICTLAWKILELYQGRHSSILTFTTILFKTLEECFGLLIEMENSRNDELFLLFHLRKKLNTFSQRTLDLRRQVAGAMKKSTTNALF